MKFLCIYKPGRPEGAPAPNPREMEDMGKLIGEMTQAGVLLATEGCLSSDKGARVRLSAGKFSVVDGPFPETKELIAGFAIIQVKTKAEAVEWTKRFLSVVREGESEIRQLREMPA